MGRIRTPAFAGIAISVCLVGAAVASAGDYPETVEATVICEPGCGGVALNGTGASDLIRVTKKEGRSQAWRIVSEGAAIEVGRRCTAQTPTVAICRVPRGNFSTGEFFSGDDRVRFDLNQDTTGSFFGEGGDDRLVGSDGEDFHFDGGAGRDVVRGRAGSDGLLGGAGRDRLEAADGERDQFVDCGDGVDTAIIDGRDRPVVDCEAVEVRHGRAG